MDLPAPLHGVKVGNSASGPSGRNASLTLAGRRKDVYRNFVFPIPVSSTRYVKGVEFRPGNAKVVHHAFINIDETRQSRRLEGKLDPPGFDGMELPESAMMPGGQLLGWQPGKIPSMVSAGLSWTLKPAADFVCKCTCTFGQTRNRSGGRRPLFYRPSANKCPLPHQTCPLRFRDTARRRCFSGRTVLRSAGRRGRAPCVATRPLSGERVASVCDSANWPKAMVDLD
jgi:hypothetical protein